MRVLKICAGTWDNASRDQRELSVCRELGAETVVLAKGNSKDHGRMETVNTFPVYRYTSRPYTWLPVTINRVVSIFQWAKYANMLNADIISGHDITGWTIGWLSQLYGQRKKPIFVYDSHEFELGRNVKRNKLQLAAIKWWEKKVIQSSAFTIVVNDSISDELVKIYNLKNRPVVVRNIPEEWKLEHDICAEIRAELLSQFDSSDGEYLLLYHGAICRNRGIEQLLFALKKIPQARLLLLGNPESKEYMDYLYNQYIIPVKDRVYHKNAVPHDQLWKYVGAADFCVMLIVPQYRSYYYALPNKLFESIQAETPILASNLPEIRRIIKKYGVGEVVNAEDTEAVASCIKEMMRKGKKQYEANLLEAKRVLSWKNEKGILLEAYSEILE